MTKTKKDIISGIIETDDGFKPEVAGILSGSIKFSFDIPVLRSQEEAVECAAWFSKTAKTILPPFFETRPSDVIGDGFLLLRSSDDTPFIMKRTDEYDTWIAAEITNFFLEHVSNRTFSPKDAFKISSRLFVVFGFGEEGIVAPLPSVPQEILSSLDEGQETGENARLPVKTRPISVELSPRNVLVSYAKENGMDSVDKNVIKSVLDTGIDTSVVHADTLQLLAGQAGMPYENPRECAEAAWRGLGLSENQD